MEGPIKNAAGDRGSDGQPVGETLIPEAATCIDSRDSVFRAQPRTLSALRERASHALIEWWTEETAHAAVELIKWSDGIAVLTADALTSRLELAASTLGLKFGVSIAAAASPQMMTWAVGEATRGGLTDPGAVVRVIPTLIARRMLVMQVVARKPSVFECFSGGAP